jgi:hypothetical protein
VSVLAMEHGTGNGTKHVGRASLSRTTTARTDTGSLVTVSKLSNDSKRE